MLTSIYSTYCIIEGTLMRWIHESVARKECACGTGTNGLKPGMKE